MEKKVKSMKSKLDLFLESFNKSVLEVTKGSYGGKWPMPYFTSLDVGSVIGEYWGDFFLEIIKKLKEKNLSIEDVSNQLKYPSPLSRAFYPNLELKYKKYPAEKIKEIDVFISEITYPFYKKDIFCKNFSNILWDKEKIKKKFNSEKIIWFKNLKETEANELIKYNGYLRAITEMLFFYFDNFGHETHGPYKLDSRNILLVREWHDLKPEYFKFSKEFPFDSIRIYEIYKLGTDIKIDISNRVFITSRTDECLLGFYFQTPEKILNLFETLSMVDKIKKTCEKGTKEITDMKPEQVLEKAALMHFYLLKPLANILGISWKPNQACMDKLKEGITEQDKKPFRALIHLELDETAIKQLFDYKLKLPPIFYE